MKRRSDQPPASPRLVRRISKSVARERPYEVWNAFLALMSDGPIDRFNDIQLIALAALRYDGEVQNGGHLQFFENGGSRGVAATIAALEAIRAKVQASILREAVQRYAKRTRKPLATVQAFVKAARMGEYQDLDLRYYGTVPSVCDRLEVWLKRYQDQFVEIVDA